MLAEGRRALLIDVPADPEVAGRCWSTLTGADAEAPRPATRCSAFGTHARATVVLRHVGSAALAATSRSWSATAPS